jgi:hypothetical protein
MSACPLYYKNKLNEFDIDSLKIVSSSEFEEKLKFNFPSISEKEIQSTLRMSQNFFITLGAEIYQVNGC